MTDSVHEHKIHHNHFSVVSCLVFATFMMFVGWIFGPVLDHVLGFHWRPWDRSWADQFFIGALIIYTIGHTSWSHWSVAQSTKTPHGAPVWLRYNDNRFSRSHMHRHPWGESYCYLDEQHQLGFLILNPDGTVITDRDSMHVVAWRYVNPLLHKRKK